MEMFKRDDEAVSPVIGVILMVAITVILAAVIAAFVFGMGPPTKSPQAQLYATDYTGATVATTAAQYNTLIKITHKGGDPITESELRYKLIAPDGEVFDSTATYAAGTTGTVNNAESAGHVNQVAAGGSDAATSITVGTDFYLEIRAGAALTTSDAGTWTVQVIHVPSSQYLLDAKVQLT